MGKLIVFEGIDGSGKSTQLNLLTKWLQHQKKDFRQIRFPRYDNPSSMLVRMYLQGEFGTDPSSINPYAASTFYAVDRYASFIQDWKEYYDRGGILLTDRYTTSNAVFQGTKIQKEFRNDFFHWLYDFEFSKICIPKPDFVILMDMPVELCQKLLQERVDSGGESKDIHELDVEFLENCRQVSLEAAESYGWFIVHGDSKGTIRSKEDIFEDIKKIVSKII